MNFCFMIPARFNSTRLPGKPLLKINNQTIISLVIKQIKKSKYKSSIYVVTDDDRIINEVGNNICIKITEECLNGTERLCHAIKKLKKKYDFIINIQGDEPFIDPNNIDYLINKYLEHNNEENLVCTTIHNKINKNNVVNRNIGKLILDNNNNVIYCSRSMIPGNKNGIPLDIDYLEHIGIFIYKYEYLLNYFSIPNTPCMLSEDIEWLKIIENGLKIKSFLIPGYHEIGINTKEDYQYLLKKYNK